MPWWGPAPGWELAFLLRTAAIRRLTVILVGDAASWVPEARVPRIPCTMDEFEARASAAAGVLVRKQDPNYRRAQALCELRPLMADMYPEQAARFPWWGYGDWDCVWGDWDSYLTDERLSQYDMISSCSYTVNGPFSLFRQEFARLYRKRLDIVQSPSAGNHLDECGMQEIVAEEAEAGRIRCLYPVDLDSSDRNETWPRCRLQGNKLYRLDRNGKDGGEILNFHFPASGRWPVEAQCHTGS